MNLGPKCFIVLAISIYPKFTWFVIVRRPWVLICLPIWYSNSQLFIKRTCSFSSSMGKNKFSLIIEFIRSFVSIWSWCFFSLVFEPSIFAYYGQFSIWEAANFKSPVLRVQLHWIILIRSWILKKRNMLSDNINCLGSNTVTLGHSSPNLIFILSHIKSTSDGPGILFFMNL